MLDDLRHAARTIGRARGLTAVLLLSLALGTGANAAVCGAVYSLLLAGPTGVADAGELVAIHTSEFSGAPYGRSSYPDFLQLTALESLEEVAAFDDNDVRNVRLRPSPDAAPGQAVPGQAARVVAVTSRFFELLRMEPRAGRLLASSDATATDGPLKPSAARAAVVSSSLAGLLGGDGIVGQTMSVGDTDYLVVGVAPRKFRGLRASRPADLWVPLAAGNALQDHGDRRLSVVARRRAPVAAVNRDLERVANHLAQRHPETNRGAITDPEAPRRITAIEYSPLEPGAAAEAAVIAAVVVGAVVLLLASACVNAGSLLLSRAMARRRELAVKMALGASRSRLIRQLLAESLLISLAAGVLGLLVAIWTTSAIPALFTPDHAELLDTSLNGRLIFLTVGISAIAGALFGIAPAVQGTGAPAALALRADAGGVSEHSGGTRFRGLLITAQLALSTVLLIGTALLINSLTQALRGDFGFAARNVAVLGIQNPGGNCSKFDPVRGVRFHRSLAELLPETEGVESVGWAATPPLGRGNLRPYSVRAGAKIFDRVDLNVNVVTPAYFRTLGVPLVEGRVFDAGDGALAEPVAIVDELLARRQFGVSAVGQHLLDADGNPIRIVGVVRSGRYRTLQDAPQPTVYLPLAQEHLACGFLFVRTSGDPEALLPLIRGRVTAVDGGVTITRATTMDRYLGEALAIDRLTTTLVGLCGLIALVMGTTGVYGVMSDAVMRRTREIGLRVALGAGRTQVVRLVFAEAVYLTVGGVVLGLAASLGLEQVAAGFVHGLPSLDRTTLAATPAVLACVVVVAALLPLRRALTVNPAIALQAE
jgi:predicted permease